jgi:uncharacterized membrane protein HdeD (DUF308 family)
MNVIILRRSDWWLLALRGAAAVLFGIAAFTWPGLTLQLLILLFAAYALVDGIVALVTAVRRAIRGGSWGWHFLQGIAGIVAGLVALFAPTIAALSLVLIIAAWAIITGIAEIALTIQLRDRLQSEWLWALAGIASIVFGVVLALFPTAGALAFVGLIALYAVVVGFLLILLGLSLRVAPSAVT